MEYMLMMYVPEHGFATADNDRNSDMPAWTAYSQALVAAGAMRAGNALHPVHTATVVRLKDGKRHVQDGPYADAKEQLGGYYVIDVPDLDAALEWAARSPSALNGAVEVRPIWQM